jgi:hypothetical protein
VSQPDVPARLLPYPELVEIHHATVARDWHRVLTTYRAISSVLMATAAVRTVGETDGSEEMLEPVARAAGAGPDQLLARTMLASRLVEIGWGIRSAKRAKYVEADQFTQFHDYLRQAERLLVEVIADNPDNPPAWNQRLMTVRGLELGKSEAQRRYGQLAKYAPHHYAGQWQLFQQLCKKWSGSFEEMHAFVRECAEASPPGSLNATLVVQAHLEHWGELPHSEEQAYLTNPAVRNDVIAAAQHSLLHPNFRPDHGWVRAHGTYALYYSLAGDPATAAIHFEMAGPYDVSDVWNSHYGEPKPTYERHRAAALATRTR